MPRFSPAFNHINDLMRAIQCAHRHIRNQHVRPLGGAQASADGHSTQIAGLYHGKIAGHTFDWRAEHFQRIWVIVHNADAYVAVARFFHYIHPFSVPDAELLRPDTSWSL